MEIRQKEFSTISLTASDVSRLLAKGWFWHLSYLYTVLLILQHETIYVGDKRVSIRTSLLEEKATAVNMLCCYADELKEGFYPYVAQVKFQRPCMIMV